MMARLRRFPGESMNSVFRLGHTAAIVSQNDEIQFEAVE
jgi:hypothetical protein